MRRLALILICVLASQAGASLYWYGGSGNWSDYANHWSNNSENSPDSKATAVPQTTDNVVFDTGSDSGGVSYTVTVDAAADCADMTWSAQDGGVTPTLAGSSALNIYGSLTLLSGMTASYSGTMTFLATSGVKTITTSSVAILCSIAFNGNGGTFRLVDNLTMQGATKNLTRTLGIFDPVTNSCAVTISGFNNSFGTLSNFNGTSRFYDLTFTGGVGTAGALFLTAGGLTEVAHTFTVAGNSIVNRVIVEESTVGNPAIILSPTWTISNADFRDIRAGMDVAVAMGDSITAGYYSYLQTDMPSTWYVRNSGVVGEGTAAMITRFASNCTAVPNARYAIIMAGVNDLVAGVLSEAQIKTNLQTMYTAASDAGLTVVACYIMPYKNYSAGWSAEKQVILDNINAWISGTAIDVDYVLDTYSLMEDPDVGDADELNGAYDSGDGIHPNAAGYAVLGTAIAGAAPYTTVAGALNLSAITGGSGDCGGNINITFTAPATRYWYKASGNDNWSTLGNWYTGTGGSGTANAYPLVQDAVLFDADSFGAASMTLTINVPRLPGMSFTGVDNSPTVTTNLQASVFGSLTLAPTASMTFSPSAQAYSFEGRSSHTLTTNGQTWANNLTLNAPGGTLVLADWPKNAATKTFNVTNGTVSLIGKVCVPAENTSFTMGAATGTLNLYNCTFYRAAAAGTLVSKSLGTLNLKNNIFYNITDVLSTSGGTNNISNNDYYTSSDEGGTGSITSDPAFVTPGTDFHLQAGSPCINAGTDLGDGTLYLDPDGLNQDNYGSGWEIGAYVYDILCGFYYYMRNQ